MPIMHHLLWSEIMIQVAMVEEGDEDEQFKAVMDEAKQAIQVSSKPTWPSLAMGDRFWLFIQTLNNDKKPFNSIFNSKTKSNYSFKEFIHSKTKSNYSFKEFIHSKIR